MGTNNLIAVYSNGDYKVAQYGQWDGYPSGQGVYILKILKSLNMIEFKERVNKCTWISDEKYKGYWKEFGVSADTTLVSCDISDKFNNKHPEFDRATEAEILNLIMKSSDGLELMNSIEFANNSLFCEWAYVIDLDKNTFEIYKGFNHNPLMNNERFYSDSEPYEAYNETRYYPVKLQASFNLNELPEEKQFIDICEPCEKEDKEE